MCLAYCEPNILVSASYDGDIIVWDVVGEKKLIKMNAYDNESRSGKKQLYAHSHQLHKKSLKHHTKKTDLNTPNSDNSQDTISTTSNGTSSSSTPNPSRLKSNLTTPSTNRPSSKLKDTRTATNYNTPDTQPCLEDWDKSNLSNTNRAVEKVSVYTDQISCRLTNGCQLADSVINKV